MLGLRRCHGPGIHAGYQERRPSRQTLRTGGCRLRSEILRLLRRLDVLLLADVCRDRLLFQRGLQVRGQGRRMQKLTGQNYRVKGQTKFHKENSLH